MKSHAALAREAVRRQMLIEAVRQALTAAQTGVRQGTVRLGRVNGSVLQHLLFQGGLRRKAARSSVVKLVWPLLPQRRRLMPLVSERGIYCFYSRALIRGIAHLVAGRDCLEVAAGDGTLSALLSAEGVKITATEDFSWDIEDRSREVEDLEAARALRAYRPAVVVCCWPPPGNTFERAIFAAPSVQTYILITSRSEAAAGDWPAYRAQQDFEMPEHRCLSRQVLPPGAGAAVHVFQRRQVLAPSSSPAART